MVGKNKAAIQDAIDSVMSVDSKIVIPLYFSKNIMLARMSPRTMLEKSEISNSVLPSNSSFSFRYSGVIANLRGVRKVDLAPKKKMVVIMPMGCWLYMAQHPKATKKTSRVLKMIIREDLLCLSQRSPAIDENNT